jgi:hypothetical protein
MGVVKMLNGEIKATLVENAIKDLGVNPEKPDLVWV